jgi:hypothetical protein
MRVIGFHAWFIPSPTAADPWDLVDQAFAAQGFTRAAADPERESVSYRGRSLPGQFELSASRDGDDAGFTLQLEETLREALGDEGLRLLLRDVCDTLGVILGRTYDDDMSGIVGYEELESGPHWLDWFQYWGPGIVPRLDLDHIESGPSWLVERRAGGACAFTLLDAPDEAAQVSRRAEAAAQLGIQLRNDEDSSAPAKRPEDEVHIEVTDSPDARAEALRTAPPAVDPVAKALSGELSIDHESRAIRVAVRSDRPRLLAGLVTIAEDVTAAPRNRARAALIVAGLEGEPGLARLARMLDAGDAHLRHAVLSLYELERFLADAELQRAVRARLDDADPRVKDAAQRLTGKAGQGPGASADSIAFQRDRLLSADDWEAVTALQQVVRSADQRSPEAALARAALREYAEQQPPQRHWDRAVDALAADPTPEDEPFLQALVRGSPTHFRAGIALRALARLNEDGAIAASLAHLAKYPSASVVEALGLAARGSGRADVVDALLAVPMDRPQYVIAALASVGGEAGRRGLITYTKARRVSPLYRSALMDAVWILRGITPISAMTRLASLGIVDRAAPADAAARSADGVPPLPYSAAFGLLLTHGAAFLYDGEASRVPCGHDTLLAEFAEVVGAGFQPEGAQEAYSASDHTYVLTFVNGRHVYRVRFQNQGDFYHPTAVADGVNRALRDAGRSEQFFQLSTSDQCAAWLLTGPDQAQQAADELLLLLDDNGPLQRAIDAL